MSAPTPAEVLATHMHDRVGTVREFLVGLLIALWTEVEGFSGKYPAGEDSDWQWRVYHPLARAGYIAGTFDDHGDLVDVDEDAGDKLVGEALAALARGGV